MTFAGLSAAAADTVSITSTATNTQLASYVSSALAAYNAGNKALAQSYLASFVSYVQSQSGTTIKAAYATLLVGYAQDLSARL